MNPSPQILIVEDDAVLVMDLQTMLTQMGYQVIGMAATGRSAIDLALQQKPDVILMDVNLRGEMNGIEAAEKIHRQVDTPVIYLTAYTDETLLQQAKTTDAYAYLAKPVREQELRASIEMALYKYNAEQRLQHLNQVLRAVRDVNQLITRERNAQDLLDEACQILLRTRGYCYVWVGQSAGNTLSPRADAGEGVELLKRIIATATPEQGQKLPGVEAFNTCKVVLCADMQSDERYAPWREEIEKFPFRSTVAVPIFHDDDLFGVLVVYAEQAKFFDAQEIDLLSELAGDIAFGLKSIAKELDREIMTDALRRNEALFRAVVDNSHDGVVMMDDQRMVKYVSSSYEQITGYAAEEVIGTYGAGYIHPDDQAATANVFRKILAAVGTSVSVEYRLRHKQGRWIWVKTTATNLLDDEHVQSVVLHSRDVTQRKQAEEELRKSEARLRAVLDNSRDAVGVHVNGIWEMCNPAAVQMFGVDTPEELLGKSILKVIAPAEHDRIRSFVRQREEGRDAPPAYETRGLKRDGTEFDMEVILSHFMLDEKLHNLVILRDVTARKQSEAALRESENQYRELFEHMHSGFILMEAIYDSDGKPVEHRLLQANAEFEAQTGLKREEEIGRKGAELSFKWPPEVAQRYYDIATNGGTMHLERFNESLQRYYDVRVFSPCKGQWAMLFNDITERKRAEEALQQSREQLQAVVQTANDAIITMDMKQNIVTWNAMAERIFGFSEEEMLGKPVTQIVPRRFREQNRSAVENAITTRQNRPIGQIMMEVSGLRKDGSEFPIEMSLANWRTDTGLFFTAIIRDITERKQAEEKIAQSEKKYRELFKVNKDGISIFPVSEEQGPLRFVELNDAAHNMLGYTREEMLQVAPEVLEPEATLEQLQARQAELSSNGMAAFETVLAHKDGRRVYAEFTTQMIEYEGKPAAMNIVRDITERKQREREMESIAILSEALRTAASRAEMLPVIVKQIVNLASADAATVEIVEPLTADVVIEVADGAWKDLSGSRQKKGTGINAIISRTLQPYHAHDLQNDPNLTYPEWARDGIRGAAGVPLIAQEKLIGFIWIGRKTDMAESEIRLLSAIGNIAANAIQRATLHEQTQKNAAELELAYTTTLEGWANALELRDYETKGHSLRVTELTVKLARLMGVTKDQIEDIRRGALLHDIGKMGIPDAILLKTGKLDEKEWEIMRKHPAYAFNLLNRIEYLKPALDIPYCHHEKWDGTGYPRKLKGEEIPFPARLFAVVDVWDAVTNDRPYRPAWSTTEAADYIRQQSGKHFDPRVVEAFLGIC